MDKSKASGKVTMSGRGDAGDVDHLKKSEADKQLFRIQQFQRLKGERWCTKT